MSAFAIRIQSELDVPVAGRIKKSMPAMLQPLLERHVLRDLNVLALSLGSNGSEPTETRFLKLARFDHLVEDLLRGFSWMPS